MKLKNNTLVLLRIDEGEYFMPERVGAIGREYGIIETTRPDDKVRNYRPLSYYVTVEYEIGGKYSCQYYRHGEWEHGPAGEPAFHAWELLE